MASRPNRTAKKRFETIARIVTKDLLIIFVAGKNDSKVKVWNRKHDRVERLTEVTAGAIADVAYKWVIIEAGYYDLAVTPNGLIKVAKSISFANMGQEEFNELYKSCFSVIWRLVLSKK